MWVSLTYSPECRGRQCGNFTLPRGSVKWGHCYYYYYLFVIAVSSRPHRMRSNIKNTHDVFMISYQISRTHNAFYISWITYHENTALVNAFSHNTSWCGSPWLTVLSAEEDNVGISLYPGALWNGTIVIIIFFVLMRFPPDYQNDVIIL